MPNLPLSTNQSIPLIGGDLPVTSLSDVTSSLPGFMQPNAPTPVRDALFTCVMAMLIRHQTLSAYAAMQCDILRATGQYLDGLLNERAVFRQPSEVGQDEVYRARGLATPKLVSPSAIVAAVNSILAPFTTFQCRYLESVMDRWYVSDGTINNFHAFINGPPGSGDVGPQYLDRLYPDDVAINGVFRPNSDPGGAWAFGDEFGRYFVIRVPIVLDADVVLMYDGPGVKMQTTDPSEPELGGAEPSFTGQLSPGFLPPSTGGRGCFVGDGSNTAGAEADGSDATFLYSNSQSTISLYQSIVNTVEKIKPHSIRWQLYADPNITS